MQPVSTDPDLIADAFPTYMKRYMKMRTRSLSISSACGECSRRELLQSLGIAAAGALVVAAGCQQQGGSALPAATVSSCSNGQCIDLADATNSDLTAAGGAMLIDTAGDTIMVIRVSDTQVIALSAICTHAGCSMDYLPAQHLLDCQCHGSQFSTDGAVTRGPARRALRVYSATITNNMITINA